VAVKKKRPNDRSSIMVMTNIGRVSMKAPKGAQRIWNRLKR